MKRRIVQTGNIHKLLHMVAALTNSSSSNERMGMVYGRPGEGKTTAITHAVIQTRGVFVRAARAWSPTSLLQALCAELQVRSARSRYPMYTAICEALAMDPRPVFIDEADYCAERADLLDTLRDIYDQAQVPVILIGMDTLPALIPPFRADRPLHGPHARFTRRITRRLEFHGIQLLDAQRVAGELCDVAVEGALPPGAAPGSVSAEGTLVERLHTDADGNVGRLVVLLEEAERVARTNDLPVITLDAWEGALQA